MAPSTYTPLPCEHKGHFLDTSSMGAMERGRGGLERRDSQRPATRTRAQAVSSGKGLPWGPWNGAGQGSHSQSAAPSRKVERCGTGTWRSVPGKVFHGGHGMGRNGEQRTDCSAERGDEALHARAHEVSSKNFFHGGHGMGRNGRQRTHCSGESGDGASRHMGTGSVPGHVFHGGHGMGQVWA